jgi:thioredoxin-dependent peroxiredoxin
VRVWIILLVAVVIAMAVFVISRFLSPGNLPQAGSPAPNFLLTSQDGSQISLKDYWGKWIVLYFYPRDFTSGCTMEAHNFERDQAEFTKRNAVILGVSVDSVGSHRKFCAKEGLNFKLLADTSHQVSKEYGSLMNFGIAQISARNTFLIDPQGRIAHAFPSVNPARHSAEVLSAIDDLAARQTDQN